VLEAFFALVLSTMCVCFWVDLVETMPDWGELTLGIVQPTVTFQTRAAMLGLIGSIIMPHNF